MIIIFGIDKQKAKLAGMKCEIARKLAVINSAKTVPFWYVEELGDLEREVGNLTEIIRLYEEKHK